MGIGAGTVGRVAVDFVLNHEAFDTGLRVVEDRVRATLGSIAGVSQRLDQALTRVGTRLTLGITVPVGAAGVAVSRLGASFDAEMTKIVTLVGVADAQVTVWKANVLDLARATAIGPAQLAQALFVVTSAGERGGNALAVLEQSAKASASGLGDTADIARVVTASIQAYGLEQLTAAASTDVLLATVREGNLEADALAGSIGRVIGIAAEAGVRFADAGAFIATYTRVGVGAAEATTALRGTLKALINPSEEAKRALAGVGLTTTDLLRITRDQGLEQALRTVVEAFGDNKQALAEVFPEVEAYAGVLATASRQAETFAAVQRNIRNSLGVTNQAFARTAQTPAFTFRQFRNEALATATAVGDRLAPAFSTLLRAINPLISIGGALLRAFTALPVPIQSTVIAIAAMVVTAGPLILVLQGIVKAIGALIAVTLLIRLGPVLLSLARAAGPAVRGILSLRTAIAALPSPIASAASLALTMVAAFHPLGLVIGPVAALAARLVSLHPTIRVLGLAALAFGAAIGGVGIATKGLSSASTSASSNLGTMADRIEAVGEQAETTRGLIERLNEEANRVGTGQPPPTPFVPAPTAIPPPIGGFLTPPTIPGAPTPTPTPPAFPLPLTALGGPEPERPRPPFVGPPVPPSGLLSTRDIGADNLEVDKIFREARQEIDGLNASAQFLPPTFDLVGAKAAVIESALKSAGKAGLKPTSEEGRKLAAELARLAGNTEQFDRQMAAVRIGADLSGDAFGAWQQQVAALEAQIAQFRADGLEGPAAALEDRLVALLDVGPPVEAELVRLAAQGEAVGPSFDTAGRSISFLRGAIESLTARGLAPGSDVVVLMQREITRLSGDTTGLAVELNAATQAGILFGDRQGALQEQVRATQARLREMAVALAQQTEALGAADPSVVALAADIESLARVYRALNAELRQTDAISTARATLESYDRELVAIGQRASIFRNAGLEGGDVIAQLEARARKGREAIEQLTSPTDQPATPQEARARRASVEAITIDVQGAERSLKIAGAIQGAFETAADGIANAFDRSVLGVIQGTTTIKQAAAAAGQSIALEFASSAVKASASWLAGQAQILAIEAATQSGLISSSATGAQARTAIAAAEAGAVAGVKGGEVTAHAVAEGTKTAATALGSSTRQGFTLAEIGESIAQKTVEVATWVQGEAIKVGTLIATATSGIASAVALGAAWVGSAIGTGIAWAVVGVQMIGTFLATAAAGIASALATAYAWIAAAAAAAAAAVASIPIVGPILAVVAAAAIIGGLTALVLNLAGARQGAFLGKDTPLLAHAGEMILPAKISKGMLRLIELVPTLAGAGGFDSASGIGPGALTAGAPTAFADVPRLPSAVSGAVPTAAVRRIAQLGERLARSVDPAQEPSALGRARTTAPVEVHIHAVDAPGVEGLFRRHGSALTKVLRERLRDGDPNLRVTTRS